MQKEITPNELCDYLTWAHMNAIPLIGTPERQIMYTQLATDFCPKNYYDLLAQAVIETNEKTGNLVTSQFLQDLHAKVTIALKNEADATKLPLAFTNYQALSSNILLTIASQTLSDVDVLKGLPDSSTLIFEVNGDSTIQGFLNDKEHTPYGCSTGQTCSAKTFLAAINGLVLYSDVEAACATLPQEV